jgi:hypothetical protein
VSIFPSPSHPHLEGEGKNPDGDWAEDKWLQILGREGASLCGSAGQDFFSWPSGARRGEPQCRCVDDG